MLQIKKGKEKKPSRWLIYAGPKWGKSTLAAKFPDPVFIDMEDGLGHLDVSKTDVCTSYSSVQESLLMLGGDSQGFQTIVFDTADWLERLISKSLCEKNNWSCLADGSYGKGVSSLETEFARFINVDCEGIRRQGFNIVFVAHAKAVRVTPPGEDAYDQWSPKCHERVSDILFEWCENVLFGSKELFSSTENTGFSQTRNVVKAEGERMLYCQDQPFAKCGNRAGLPNKITLTAFEAGLPNFFDSKERKNDELTA